MNETMNMIYTAETVRSDAGSGQHCGVCGEWTVGDNVTCTHCGTVFPKKDL